MAALLASSTGAPPLNTTTLIDYKALRQTNPATARQAVLAYHASQGGNVAATARAFGVTRPVVYDILGKAKSGNLEDRSRRPLRQPNRRRRPWKSG